MHRGDAVDAEKEKGTLEQDAQFDVGIVQVVLLSRLLNGVPQGRC